MVNIAELLKYAPKGTKLYSPLFGEVKLFRVDKRRGYPIDVIDCNGNGKSFTEFGVYFANHPDAECLLFPSKECRTWEGWTLPVEHEFKVGDWVVRKDGETFYGGNYAEQITLIEVDGEGRCIWLSSTSWVRDDAIRSWTIEDAKDGDVLAAAECYVIFKEIDWLSIKCYCTYHYMGVNPSFYIDTLQNKTAFEPANKEQCDLLFKKMEEAGYQWDADKKQLRKIKPHYDISNFHAGMPVLVRDKDNRKWCYLLYSHYDNTYEDGLCFNAGSVEWRQCIPYNDDTKHLLGTTNMPIEEYINW